MNKLGMQKEKWFVNYRKYNMQIALLLLFIPQKAT